MSIATSIRELEEFLGIRVPKSRVTTKRTQTTTGDRGPQTPSVVSTPALSPEKVIQKYEPLEFDTPLDLLKIARDQVNPHGWQAEELEILGGYLDGIPGKKYQPSEKEALFYNFAAANGSGKDAYIIAPFAVWFCCSKIRSRCVITSSSYEQLKFQTFKYIVQLCESITDTFGEKIFDIVEFHIRCRRTGSEIKCFVTDEAGKAEGFHPDPEFPDAEMAFIANEAKSIDEELWEAFNRYTGFNYWLEISSPGGKGGHFYRTCTDERTIAAPMKVRLGRRRFRRVTAYECPHISRESIEERIREYGINNPLIRSSIFAEFSEHDTNTIISTEHYDNCFRNPPRYDGADLGIGLDLAAGGDENACFVRRGNRVIKKFFFVQKDTDTTSQLIHMNLAEFHGGEYDFRADNGGVGTAIIDRLARLGWRIKRCNNQSPANNKTLFLNLGAEMYHRVKRHIERSLIILPKDSPANMQKLREQITTRKVKSFNLTQGRWALQSKPDAKAEGMPSPDRGDAFVLCFCSYFPSPEFIKGEEEKDPTGAIPMDEFIRLFDAGRIYKGFNKAAQKPPARFPSILDKVTKI